MQVLGFPYAHEDLILPLEELLAFSIFWQPSGSTLVCRSLQLVGYLHWWHADSYVST